MTAGPCPAVSCSRRLARSAIAAVAAAGLLWAAAAPGANIGERTAMTCVPEKTLDLGAFGAPAEGEGPADSTRARFGQWLFNSGQPRGSSEIRFLWIPQGASGPRLRVHTSDTHHVLVDVRAQDRHSVIAVSAASDPLTLVGWLFSINFEREQVMAASVQSNAAGSRSESVRFSCSFDSRTPAVDTPAPGNRIG